MATVCRPEEQKRLTVAPAVVTGQPAQSAALRPTLVPVAPFGVGAADEHVLDLGRFDAGALDGVLDRMAGHGRPVGVVEFAPEGLGEPGPGGRDDDGFAHGEVLPETQFSAEYCQPVRRVSMAARRAGVFPLPGNRSKTRIPARSEN